MANILIAYSGYFFVIIAICIALYQIKESPLDPVIWSEPNELPSFQGSTKVNNILDHAYKISKDFGGPESTAIDSDTGIVYASFNDGTIGSFNSKGEFLERIFFSGGFQLKQEGHGINQESEELMNWCHIEGLSKRLAWNVTGENLCGRPLGIRIYKKDQDISLIIIDAYHGLFQLNLETKQAFSLYKSQQSIPTPKYYEYLDPKALLKPKFLNDLDILPNGDIVFTDSSYKNSRSENRLEILDGASRGRLLIYVRKLKKVEVLLCGLHFPNGVQSLASNPYEVLVADMARFRILKVNTKSDFLHGKPLKLNETEFHHLSLCEEYGSTYYALNYNSYETTGVTIFKDSVPGLSDNIRLDSYAWKKENKERYLVGIGSISVQPFSLVWFAYQNLWMREIVGKLIPMHLVELLVPKYGLIYVLDGEGKEVSAWHSPKGITAYVSQGERHSHTGDVWLGSHSEQSIGILPSQYVQYQE